MASDFLKLDRTTPQGSATGQCVDLTAQLLGLLRQRAAVYAHIANGGDYASLGTFLGLSATDAQGVYNLLTGALAAIDVSAVQQFCQRVG